MTTNQQQILDSLTREFEKMNAKVETKGFNLIDINPLNEKNRVKAQWMKMHKEDENAWKKACNIEASRIEKLLQSDLDGYYVDSIIDDTLSPKIIISQCYDTSKYADKRIIIYIERSTELRTDEYGGEWRFGSGFRYKYNSTSFPTIEEICNLRSFKEELRTKILI
jgi:hypothetical protein